MKNRFCVGSEAPLVSSLVRRFVFPCGAALDGAIARPLTLVCCKTTSDCLTEKAARLYSRALGKATAAGAPLEISFRPARRLLPPQDKWRCRPAAPVSIQRASRDKLRLWPVNTLV